MPKKIFKYFSDNKALVIIILITVVLRLYKISSNPPALNWDEVSHGYNAYSILKSGKDEWGNFFPIIFRAYGDYKLPVYIYATAKAEILFGLNVFAIRFPSVLAGILSVIFTYLLVFQLFVDRQHKPFKVKHIALLSALLVAIEPWSLFLSRGAFEANLALTFIMAGVYLFLKGINRSANYFLPSIIMFGFSVWTYNSARIFTPLFIIFISFLYRNELCKSLKTKKILIYCLMFVFSISFLPMFWQLINQTGRARYSWVSIIDEGAIAKINEARNSSDLNPFLNRLVNNKVTYFTKEFTGNWMRHYSADYLFFKGGNDYQFNIPGKGLIYPVNALFLIVGVLLLLKRRDKQAFLLLGWFYLGSIASSLTRESPHVLRSITMLPSPMILTAYGFISLFGLLKNRFFERLCRAGVFIYLILLTVSLCGYLKTYFNEYKRLYSWSWQYGYREAVLYIKDNYERYDKVIFTKKYGEPHEFLLFFWPWDPLAYQNDPDLNRFYQSKWYWVDRFDKFWFVNDWDIPSEEWQDFVLESGEYFNCNGKHCLLVTSPGNAPKNWKIFKTINFLDGSIAFEMYKNF